MTTRKDRAEKTGKELFLEQAAAENATYGQTFNRAESFAVLQGRELIRQSLEMIVQEQIDDLEKKRKRRSVRNAKRKKGIEDTERNAKRVPSEMSKSKDVMTNVSLAGCPSASSTNRSDWRNITPSVCVALPFVPEPTHPSNRPLKISTNSVD